MTAKRIADFVLWGTLLAGSAGLAWSLLGLGESTNGLAILLVVSAAIVAELLKVTIFEVRQQTLSFSLSMLVIMAAITIDPFLGPLAGFIAALVHVLVTRQRDPTKIAFNLANLTLAATVASGVYVAVRPSATSFGLGHLVAAGCAVLGYFLLNTGLISAMVSIHSGRPFGIVMRDSAWFAPTSILLGLTGAFLGGIHDLLGLVGAIMFLVPVLLMRFTLAFYAQRSQATIKTLDDQARHDALTGLPNRLELQDRLADRLAQLPEAPFALLMMDLDRFKEINDTFGHQHGDLLLMQIGPRFKDLLAQSDTIARLGGDEFAILLHSADAAAAVLVAEQLLDALRGPFLVGGQRLDVAASIGVAVAPWDGPDPMTLLRRADVAMYTAKRDQSGFARYTAESDGYRPERLALVADLRQAIAMGELTLFFQPKVQCGTGRTDGTEALVRWFHPQRGFVPPDVFVPLAEHTGLIKPLTRWVLATALRECRGWLDAGWDMSVAVNVSVHDLHDANFPELVADLLVSCDVPARYLRVEVTEGAMMADFARTREILERVRALGVGVSIDDFGTGYSSLAYLKRLPVDELKIDRSFVQQLALDPHDRAIVRATITLGHDLGLTVVAEGAEDLPTLELLTQLGCDHVQGYFHSKPLPIAELMQWLASRPADRSELAEAA